MAGSLMRSTLKLASSLSTPFSGKSVWNDGGLIFTAAEVDSLKEIAEEAGFEWKEDSTRPVNV